MPTLPVTLPNLHELALHVSIALSTRQQRLAVAESCTGGWIAKVATDLPGSSAWFDRGFISYSNAAKTELLGVQASTLSACGAVSAEVVAEMATGALARSHADVALAVSGIAGPDGGSTEKPVGTVYLAWAWRDGTVQTEKRLFAGNRDAVRLQTVAAALQGILNGIAHQP